MKIVRFWLAMGLAALCHVQSACAEEDGVAQFGNPLRLEIRGAQTFKEDEIRKRLLGDLEVANACYPTTSVEELCKLLTSKAREAYLYSGFADVELHTVPSADGTRLEITLVEGQRYLAGDVVVRGTNAIDGTALVHDLTAAPSPDDPAWKKRHTRWSTGEPAWLNPSASDWCRDEIETRLLEHGRIGAQFTVEIVPDRERRLAILLISFADEGRDALLNEISVTGNKKNSQEEVLAYLGLEPGMICRGDLETDVWRKLWESGRFTKSRVELVKPSQTNDALRLAIQVEEYEKAPPLKEELSREEAALVKLGCWLNRFSHTDEEIVIRFEDEGDVGEFVAAPGQGYIVMLRLADDKKSPAPFALAFVMCDERIGVYSTMVKRKIEGIPTPGRVRGNIDLSLHDGPPRLTGYGRLKLGLGLNTTSKQHGLCSIRFEDTPVSLLSLAHEYDSKLSWSGDVLTVAYRERQISLDSETGQFVKERSWIDQRETTLTRTKGEFQRLLKEIDSVAADFEQGNAAEGPLAAALALSCDTGLAYLTGPEDAEDRKLMRLLRKMSNLGIVEPIDRLVVAACNAPVSDFYIPESRTGTYSWNLEGVVNVPLLKYFGGKMGIEYADLLTSPGSWPWKTWREAMFALAGKSRHLEQELVKHLSASESGPVRHLIVGELLRANEMPAMARVFGLAGETRLTAEGFRNDYAAFLDGESFIGHCLLTLADVIRQLDESEVQTLSKELVESEWMERQDARIFADLARRLRRDRESPVAQVLGTTLDAWWNAGLREFVKKELHKLAAGPKPSSTASQTLAADNWRYRWHRGRWWYYGQNGAWQYWTGNAWAAWPNATAGRPARRR